MAEICRLTGAAEGTIFYHFKSKEDLFLAILEDFKKTVTEEFRRHSEPQGDERGIDMMERAISFYLDLASMMEERFLLLHRYDLYRLAEVNPVFRVHLEAIYNHFLDIFEQPILRGQEDGSIGRLPARKTALIIFCMVDGLVRFNTYKLYDAGALYKELVESCRRILQGEGAQL